MWCRKCRRSIVICGVVAALLSLPAASHASGLCEALFGPSVPSQTTYLPPYLPPVPAPACGCGGCASPCCGGCGSPIWGGCGARRRHAHQALVRGARVFARARRALVRPAHRARVRYSHRAPVRRAHRAPARRAEAAERAPRKCVGYAPAVAYQAAYCPAPACSSCGCEVPVTTYRPVLGLFEDQLVPYTTYHPIYTPVVTYGCGCESCGGCSAVLELRFCAACDCGGCGCAFAAAVSSALSVRPVPRRRRLARRAAQGQHPRR